MVVDLKESREKIDKIDREITRLFEERMEVANDVAAYKRSTGKKVYDPEREQQKLDTLRGYASTEFNETAVEDLFRQIMSISRKYQYQKLGPGAATIPFQQVDALEKALLVEGAAMRGAAAGPQEADGEAEPNGADSRESEER